MADTHGAAPDDWRRQGQEKYLMGISLVAKDYTPPSDTWDHDHCEFCGAKFSPQDGDLHNGYTTLGGYSRWICSECFEDFKGEFGWTVASK